MRADRKGREQGHGGRGSLDICSASGVVLTMEMVAAILHSGLFILWVISWRREECAELTYTLNADQPSAIIWRCRTGKTPPCRASVESKAGGELIISRDNQTIRH